MRLETECLIIRELEIKDVEDLFEIESDPEVHKFIEKKPVESIKTIYKIIDNIKEQYLENGVGRLAVLDKKTNECIGWCGLRFFREELNKNKNFYELAYRFKKKHWGKGYATESARAIINFTFSNLELKEIYATINPDNLLSKKVLEKLGFKFVENFAYEGDLISWFKLKI